MTSPRATLRFVLLASGGLLVAAGPLSAQDRPPVGPERPFQLAARVERTLPNGLRVTAAASFVS